MDNLYVRVAGAVEMNIDDDDVSWSVYHLQFILIILKYRPGLLV